jgi:hypothetical protein
MDYKGRVNEFYGGWIFFENKHYCQNWEILKKMNFGMGNIRDDVEMLGGSRVNTWRRTCVITRFILEGRDLVISQAYLSPN